MNGAIGETLAAACADREVLARLRGPAGDAARQAFDQLERSPPERRRALCGRWAAAARAPVPPGIRGADASWLEAALAELPASAREAIASGALDEVSVWLARSACAGIPPLPAIDPRRVTPSSIAEAVTMSAAALRGWLDQVGLDQLAFALGAHAPQVRTMLGERLTQAVTRIAIAPRAGELGPRRAAIERARVELEELALLRIGARAIAPHTDPLARRQLAVRLSRPIGSVLFDELTAHAIAPIELAPSWRALAAP